ncbi:hypothetical protein Btru_022080 [Bulinus truncatus]|nr:hypothetical protein Btru_022080 [Bulinus truncatus]
MTDAVNIPSQPELLEIIGNKPENQLFTSGIEILITSTRREQGCSCHQKLLMSPDDLMSPDAAHVTRSCSCHQMLLMLPEAAQVTRSCSCHQMHLMSPDAAHVTRSCSSHQKLLMSPDAAHVTKSYTNNNGLEASLRKTSVNKDSVLCIN